MSKNIVGVIPAASRGTRLAPLPFHKALLPLGLQEISFGDELLLRPKMVGQYILESLKIAGAEHVFIVVGENSEAFINYFGNGSHFGVEIAYLFQDNYNGIPYALDLVNSWLPDDSTILFGMPDTIVRPYDAYAQLLSQHNNSKASVTLGAFRINASNPNKFCMIELGSDFQVTKAIDKPESSNLDYMWGIAAWSKDFSDFVGSYIKKYSKNLEKELLLGSVVQQAIVDGFDVRAVCFDDGDYLDIGTVDDLLIAIKRYFNN